MATDKRLDQVSTLTDFDYALIVKGDQVAKASKQQLAELVGNLLYGATNASSLATVVAENNPKTINALRGRCLYKIGGASKWNVGSFMASVADASGNGCSLIGISFRHMNTIRNVTYTRTGDSTLGIQVYKRIVGDKLEVFIYSKTDPSSFNPLCCLSSQQIELVGEITDLSGYTLVVSW